MDKVKGEKRGKIGKEAKKARLKCKCKTPPNNNIKCSCICQLQNFNIDKRIRRHLENSATLSAITVILLCAQITRFHWKVIMGLGHGYESIYLQDYEKELSLLIISLFSTSCLIGIIVAMTCAIHIMTYPSHHIL